MSGLPEPESATPGCLLLVPALVVWFLFALALVTMPGCGGASPEVRVSYAAEVARCLAAEREIIDREGTTHEQDDADFATERARCDEALVEIAGE